MSDDGGGFVFLSSGEGMDFEPLYRFLPNVNVLSRLHII